MGRRANWIHICDFSCGLFSVQSEGGGQGLLFEDSDRFGPSKVHPREGDLSPVPDGLIWFWKWYPVWRNAGRPVTGQILSTPIGEVQFAVPAVDGGLKIPIHPLPDPPASLDEGR